MKRQWAIFFCIKDECWVVCRSMDDDPDTLIGVAECPDAHTARVVLEAMRSREKTRGKSLAVRDVQDVQMICPQSLREWFEPPE